MAKRLRWGLRWRLSVLWALEWGITGATLTYIPLYFAGKGLAPEEFAQLMAVTATGLWVAPIVVGQICDRWLASERYLAIAHFVGGLTLLAIPIATDVYGQTRDNFSALVALVGLYAVAYFPTVPLASALSFRHLPDPDAQFSKVRVWGTVGWVLAGWSLSLWLGRHEAYAWLSATFPSWSGWLAELRSAFSWMAPPSSSDCFTIAALLSFALSSFCVFLPHTPPARKPRGRIAPLQFLSMFRDPTFALLIAISCLLALAVPLYTTAVPKLLRHLGFADRWVPAVMTIGQISEFPALVLLPICLHRYGLKTTIAVGIAAWSLRYAVFAAAGPAWAVLSGIALHGVCHVFLIIAIQLYVDARARSDLRTTAQNLLAFLTMGVAMPAGFLLAGALERWCVDSTGEIDFAWLFAIPSLFVLAILVAYLRWFRFDSPTGTRTRVAVRPIGLAASGSGSDLRP